MTRHADRAQVLKEAWIGDAVLTLHARLKILREDCVVDGQKADRMTSNQFLSVYSDPSETEAAIGRIYQRDGLPAAFEWIEHRLAPVFERQEANRRKR